MRLFAAWSWIDVKVVFAAILYDADTSPPLKINAVNFRRDAKSRFLLRLWTRSTFSPFSVPQKKLNRGSPFENKKKIHFHRADCQKRTDCRIVFLLVGYTGINGNNNDGYIALKRGFFFSFSRSLHTKTLVVFHFIFTIGIDPLLDFSYVCIRTKM